MTSRMVESCVETSIAAAPGCSGVYKRLFMSCANMTQAAEELVCG
jgi:hypothetical protein